MRGEVLWEPSAGSLATHAAGSLPRVAHARTWGWSSPRTRSSGAGRSTICGAFWASIAEWTGTRWHAPPGDTLRSRAMPGAQWFVGGQLNYAEHALRSAATRPDETAVVAHSQTRAPRRALVGRARRGGRSLPPRAAARSASGAATASWRTRPNIPETLVAFLASREPRRGLVVVRARVRHACRSSTASRRSSRWCCVAVDGYRYGERAVDRRAEVADIEAALPTLRATVHVPYLDDGPRRDRRATASSGPSCSPSRPARVRRRCRSTTRSTCSSARARPGCPRRSCTATAASRSSTRSRCGCTTTSATATASSWFTTTGWMMWNFLVSGLLVGVDARAVRRRSRRSPTSARCGASPPTPTSTCSA